MRIVRYSIFYLIGCLFCSSLAAFVLFENKALVVENQKAVLSYHLIGGGLSGFKLKESSITPFLNSFSDSATSAQFIQLENQYQAKEKVAVPSVEKEIVWDLVNSPITKKGSIEMMMKGDFLKEKLTVRRFVNLDIKAPFFSVKEDYYNYSNKDITLNILQKIFLNPEFVNGAEIHSNTGLTSKVDRDVISVNLKGKVRDGEKFGWLVISNPTKNQLMGYIWKVADFQTLRYGQLPGKYFLELESAEESGDPVAPSSSVSKNYICFLLPLANGFKGVSAIEFLKGKFILIEKDNSRHGIEVARSSHLVQ